MATLSKRNRRTFSLSFKLKVVKTYFKNRNYTKTASLYNIDRKTLRKWVKNYDAMKKIKNKRFHIIFF
jgi:transposase-like protein